MTPTHDEWFMEMAQVVSKRSTCTRGQVGALIVLDRRIISIGYNGSPPGQPECIEVGCDTLILHRWREDHDDWEEVYLGCQRSIHAEANAIAWAARHGLPVGGATMYCTHGPCLGCAKLMASAGIARSVWITPYRDSSGSELLGLMGIPCERPR